MHDINLVLLGDPGTAKNQLLKFVEKVSPIRVYTSGKRSSASIGISSWKVGLCPHAHSLWSWLVTLVVELSVLMTLLRYCVKYILSRLELMFSSRAQIFHGRATLDQKGMVVTQ